VKPEDLKLLGGALCLHFVNSTDWHEDGSLVEEQDGLVEPDSLVRWGRRLGVLRDGEADPAELAAARALRPHLRALILAAAHGEPPDADLVLRTYAQATSAAHLSPTYTLDWPDSDPRKVRFAVVADAISLLSDPERLARVHLCPGRDCGYLFINASGRRKWCSMDTCGSRAKMRALYARRTA
jgi:predicted RNA-binding Zn ribbon-like protein